MRLYTVAHGNLPHEDQERHLATSLPVATASTTVPRGIDRSATCVDRSCEGMYALVYDALQAVASEDI